jgi:hypothetical protein
LMVFQSKSTNHQPLMRSSQTQRHCVVQMRVPTPSVCHGIQEN